MKLPRVSVVIVETRAHQLARITVEKLIEKVEPAAIWIYTDQPDKLHVAGATHLAVPDWPNKDQCGLFFTYEAFKPLATSHVLFMEWDAGLFDASMWDDGFLAYDYIGAPWWDLDNRGRRDEKRNVGNGGFSLRSMKLCEAIADNPQWCGFSDWPLCRDSRPHFEGLGFKWAPIALADAFAIEDWQRPGPPDQTQHFGYHYMMPAWPRCLERDDMIQRANLVQANASIMSSWRHRKHFGELVKALPWLAAELGR